MGVRDDGSHAGDDDDQLDGRGVKGAENWEVDASDSSAKPRCGNNALSGINPPFTLKTS